MTTKSIIMPIQTISTGSFGPLSPLQSSGGSSAVDPRTRHVQIGDMTFVLRPISSAIDQAYSRLYNEAFGGVIDWLTFDVVVEAFVQSMSAALLVQALRDALPLSPLTVLDACLYAMPWSRKNTCGHPDASDVHDMSTEADRLIMM